MKTLKTEVRDKDRKVPVEIQVPDNIHEALREFGEAFVYQTLIAKITNLAQNSARQLFRHGASQIEVMERMRSWRPNRRMPRRTKLEILLGGIECVSKEEEEKGSSSEQ